jgi:hypothetical protein
MENASAAFLGAVRKSMRQIRSALGAAFVDPALLTAAERLQSCINFASEPRTDADSQAIAQPQPAPPPALAERPTMH